MIEAICTWRARRSNFLTEKDTDLRQVIPVRVGTGTLLCRLWVGPSDLIMEAFGEARDWVSSWQLPWCPKTKKLPGGYRVPAVLVDDLAHYIVERLSGPYAEQHAELEAGLVHLRTLGWAHMQASEYRGDKPNMIPQSANSDALPLDCWEWMMGKKVGQRLYPYQREGVTFLTSRTSALLADDMGLGKTPQALAALHFLRNAEGAGEPSDLKKALVVCPSSVVLNWAREAAVWAPSYAPVPILSSKDMRSLPIVLGNHSLLIVSWGMIARVRAQLLEQDFSYVIADEAHYAKNPDAARTRVFTEVAHRSPVRWLLTGTPMRNRPKEVWSLLHIMDPFAFPTFIPFGERYCGARNQRIRRGAFFDTIRTYEGSARLKELRETVLSRRMLRRMKVDVLPDLPRKRFQRLDLTAPPSFRREYELALQLLRSEQISGEGTQGLGIVTKLRAQVGLTKVDVAMEWLEDVLETKEPVVVFFTHKLVAEALRERLKGLGVRVGEIVGSTTTKRRQAAVEAFQAGDLDVMLCSEAAKEGITLTRAAFMLRVEYWWSPGDQEQSEDRICRIGQDRSCLITTLHLVDSLDDHVEKVLGTKRENIEVAMRPMAVELVRALTGGASC